MAEPAGETEIAVAVVARGDQVLIGQRPPEVPLAGYWEFPGGKVLPRESPAAAAVRECCEETNLLVVVRQPLPVVRHEYAHGPLMLHFFLCELCPDSPPPRAGYRWIERGELPEYTFPPANQPILQWLMNR